MLPMEKSVKFTGACAKNKSWKPECVLSFNMGLADISKFYPSSLARDKILLQVLRLLSPLKLVTMI
jgi:hypothetical protein